LQKTLGSTPPGLAKMSDHKCPSTKVARNNRIDEEFDTPWTEWWVHLCGEFHYGRPPVGRGFVALK
jgi:hypothetical protein